MLQPLTTVDIGALVDDMTLARICDRYKKLPSEVRREDYQTMMRVWYMQRKMDVRDHHG